MLKGKHILLGITGSIAAYKAANLVRLLVKEGAEVQIVMTEMAKQFITPLTMATLSKRPILVDFYNPENGDWNSHVNLGIWADLYLIAPCSANTIAKMANGIADNLLLTSYLSAKCPVAIAPAMDLDMYKHIATTKNLYSLKNCGVHIIEAKSGELASGLQGKGRMEEPEAIVEEIKSIFAIKTCNSALLNKKILITAGPTREKIDPVRYISNYSTGKMGYAIAEMAAKRGANVTLISGPVEISTINPKIKLIKVESASEMFEQSKNMLAEANIIILSAAVADFKPCTENKEKIKREGIKNNNLIINLSPNKDIAAWIGEHKDKKQISVGFALETNNEVENAHKKLKRKNLNMIVLNSLNDSGAGFGYNTNKIKIILDSGQTKDYELKSKIEVANDILDNIENLIN